MHRRQFLSLFGAAGLLPAVNLASAWSKDVSEVAEAESPKALDLDGSPLIRAILREDIDEIKSLLRKGIDINAKGNYGNSPLHWWAVGSKSIAIGEILISQGADVNAKNNDGNCPLHWAAEYNRNTDVVPFLVANNADVNAKNNVGNTPLHRAAAFGNVEIVKNLISQGADVRAANDNGYTALNSANYWNNAAVVEYLVGILPWR